MADTEQPADIAAWLAEARRVLGLPAHSPEPDRDSTTSEEGTPDAAFDADAFRRDWAAAKAAWIAANDSVDGQLSKLQETLLSDQNPAMNRIGEFGLNAITAGTKVKMMAAIRDIDSADEDRLPSASKTGLTAVANFENLINSDPRIAVCDNNPWDIPVDLRKTLAPALAQLRSTMESARG